MLGDHRFLPRAAWRVHLEALCLAINTGPDDHIVVGTGPSLLLSAGLVFPRARLVLGRGVDGADIALLRASRNTTHLAARYDRVVLCSGDGIFSSRVAEMVSAGLEVGVVARPGTLASRLSRVASWVRPFMPYGEAA